MKTTMDNLGVFQLAAAAVRSCGQSDYGQTGTTVVCIVSLVTYFM